MPRYLKTLYSYISLSQGKRFGIKSRHLMPVFADDRLEAGFARGHYFWQDLWAAKKIYERRPPEHVDIGSRVDGFIAHLLIFMDVKLIDIRPLGYDVPRLSFIQEDATLLEGIKDSSIESVSSLHAVEHFGLGRYGDVVEPEADYKAMKALARILKPGGRLYFAVPVGKECVYFNAHRVYSPLTIIKRFQGLTLLSYSVINDSGRFFANARLEEFADAKYSCGLFEFTKR